MNEPKTYTAADIERYHSGALSAAERHALERASLDDPFLADALEGYAATQTPSADLEALKKRLQLRIEKRKERQGLFYLNNWLKVAALFVLMAGGGLAVLWLFNNNKEHGMAIKNSRAEQPTSSNKSFADSTPNAPDASSTTQAPLIEKEQERTKDKASPDNTLAAKTRLSKTNNSPAVKWEAPKQDGTKENATAARIPGTLQGRAAGIIVNKPADDAVVSNEEKKAAPAAVYKNSGYVAPSKDTIKNFNVTMRRTELPADETVVLNKKTNAQRQARRLDIRIDSTEPAEGWVRFDDYVSQNLKEPEELKTKGLRGEVELSFDVNKEGEAVNIAVTKSLCDKCDEEAVRLLKEGPKWKKNKTKGKVKIRFPMSP